jgi:hypothetical protein
MPGAVVEIKILNMADVPVHRAEFLSVKLLEILQHGKLRQIYASASRLPMGCLPSAAEMAPAPVRDKAKPHR